MWRERDGESAEKSTTNLYVGLEKMMTTFVMGAWTTGHAIQSRDPLAFNLLPDSKF